jgi:hypothetical protein
MARKAPHTQVWKQTSSIITLEPTDMVVREIKKETTWTESIIKEKLFEKKLLIQLSNAKYHIYRDSLG